MAPAAGWSRDARGIRMSFRLSFHQAPLGPSGAHWLDDPSDLTCKDSTQHHPVDDPLLSCKQGLTAVCRCRRLLRPADTGRRDLGPPSPTARYQACRERLAAGAATSSLARQPTGQPPRLPAAGEGLSWPGRFPSVDLVHAHTTSWGCWA